MKLIDLLKVIHEDECLWLYDCNNRKNYFYTNPAKVNACHNDKEVMTMGTTGEGTLEIYIK